MHRLNLTLILIAILTFSAHAQERVRSMLVLDASGSMWGQIDGTAKITIAKRVVNDLLDTIPEEQALGLTVYGHRVKGNCADIQTLVTPGRGTRAAIKRAVSGLSPKGKTPLSDAVLIAADALKFTESPATVILVTDGVETCDRDPCALARSLEKAGVDFTAHVVGFDVAKVDLPKLQCLADETGGKFLTANNANQLSQALTSVATVSQPLPKQKRQKFGAQFEASDANGLILSPLEWTVIGPDGPVIENYVRNQLVSSELEIGVKYRVIARKPDTGETTEFTFTAPDVEGFVYSRTLVFR